MNTIIYKNNKIVRETWSDTDFLELISIHGPMYYIEQIIDNLVINAGRGEYQGPESMKPIE
jgi:hypothetical protein